MKLFLREGEGAIPEVGYLQVVEEMTLAILDTQLAMSAIPQTRTQGGEICESAIAQGLHTVPIITSTPDPHPTVPTIPTMCLIPGQGFLKISCLHFYTILSY